MSNFLDEVHIIDDVDAKDLAKKIQLLRKLQAACRDESMNY
jgi:hypothetical protein